MKKKRSKRNTVYKSPLLFVIALLILLTIVIFTTGDGTFKLPSRAEPVTAIETQDLARDSVVDAGETSVKFNLYTEDQEGALYETDRVGLEGMLEMLDESPELPADENGVQPAVKGAFSADAEEKKRILDPKNFVLRKKFDDREDEILKAQGIDSQISHYFLEQQIEGVPVFGAALGIHQEGKRVTAMFGNVTTDSTVPEAQLSREDAEAIALGGAREAAGDDASLGAYSQTVIYNGEVTGAVEADTNHIAADVVVRSQGAPLTFNSQYIVDLLDGTILFQQNRIMEAKRRQVYNCQSANCPLARDDDSRTSPTGDSEIDQSYDFLGDVYDFYFNTFGRDSFDNRGAAIKGYVHFPGSGQIRCPNAAWTGREMVACSGMIARDIWGHEVTHAVTQVTAGLNYTGQSGALNESMSDIFGYAVDPDDWEMGEELTHPRVPKPIRHMDDPTRRGDPDRLFSPNYYCGTTQTVLVHTNSGVLNKAFYLMTDGDSFNGCSIRGIGREKSLAVIYQALTKPGYLGPSSNMKDAYDVIVRACTDLSTAGGSPITADDCAQVKAALQAAEMDQQPARGQTSPVCPGARGQRKEPSCAGAPPPATATPGQTAAPTSRPTASPTGPQSTPTTEPQASATPVPTAPPEPTDEPTESFEGLSVFLKLRFQGIGRRPEDRLNRLEVTCSVGDGQLSAPVSDKATFVADERGVWEGQLRFAGVSAGTGFKLVCKGPKHIAKKVCEAAPTERFPGSYACDSGRIALVDGAALDFSSIVMLVGDLPQQDGWVTGYDIAAIRNNFGKADAASLAVCDLNLDGTCNSTDHALVIQALSIKADEQ